MRGFYTEDRLYPFFKYDYMLKVALSCGMLSYYHLGLPLLSNAWWRS